MAGKIDKALQQLLKQSIKIMKLWENASPTSAFAAQKINANLAGYDDIVTIYFGTATGSRKYAATGKITTLTAMLNIASTPAIYFAARNVDADNTGISFTACNGKTGASGTPGQGNTYCVPIAIYGIKLLGA